MLYVYALVCCLFVAVCSLLSVRYCLFVAVCSLLSYWLLSYWLLSIGCCLFYYISGTQFMYVFEY